MTQHTPFSPLSHERGPNTPAPRSDRVDDEYVFIRVVDESHSAADRKPVEHSIRVDPDDGADDELLLHVTKRRRHPTKTSDGESYSVTVPAPGLGDPPRISALESTLEAWFNQRNGPETSLATWFQRSNGQSCSVDR